MGLDNEVRAVVEGLFKGDRKTSCGVIDEPRDRITN